MLSVGEEAGVKLQSFVARFVARFVLFVASYVAGLETALICPFVQATFPMSKFSVLPEITIGHF